jgi:hypothetical protein
MLIKGGLATPKYSSPRVAYATPKGSGGGRTILGTIFTPMGGRPATVNWCFSFFLFFIFNFFKRK